MAADARLAARVQNEERARDFFGRSDAAIGALKERNAAKRKAVEDKEAELSDLKRQRTELDRTYAELKSEDAALAKRLEDAESRLKEQRELAGAGPSAPVSTVSAAARKASETGMTPPPSASPPQTKDTTKETKVTVNERLVEALKYAEELPGTLSHVLKIKPEEEKLVSNWRLQMKDKRDAIEKRWVPDEMARALFENYMDCRRICWLGGFKSRGFDHETVARADAEFTWDMMRNTSGIDADPQRGKAFEVKAAMAKKASQKLYQPAYSRQASPPQRQFRKSRNKSRSSYRGGYSRGPSEPAPDAHPRPRPPDVRDIPPQSYSAGGGDASNGHTDGGRSGHRGRGFNGFRPRNTTRGPNR